MKSHRVICILPFPSAFPEETEVLELRAGYGSSFSRRPWHPRVAWARAALLLTVLSVAG